MNLRHIQEMLSKRYSEVKKIKPDIFKATYLYKAEPVGIYFVDCSGALKAHDFNLKKYQENLISKSYYEKPGPLQWNYYLYFICDPQEYREFLRKGFIGEIENDKIFAKKIVTTESLLEEELNSIERLKGFRDDKIPEDISVRWIEELKQYSLDGIFMFEKDQSSVVKKYLEGKPYIEQADQSKDVLRSQETPSVSFIEQLQIDRNTYRQYPRIENFLFGTVNLFEGVNGSGKTSLLEAIELWMCGKTMRNPEQHESALINIQFRGTDKLVSNKNVGNEVFRARDLAWYGNAYTKGNRLFQGFNRFNMYDSDAAYRLAIEEESIEDAISSIVLGEIANKLQYRMGYIRDLFEREQKSAAIDLRTFEQVLQDARENLRTIRNISDDELNRAYDNFVSLLKGVGWRNELPDRNNASSFLTAADKILAILSTAHEVLGWLSDLSLLTINNESEILESLINIVEGHDRELKDAVKLEKTSLKEIEQLTVEETYFRGIEPYLSDEKSSQLLGLDHKIIKKIEIINISERAKELIKGVDLSKFLAVSERLPVFEKELEDIVMSQKKTLHEVEKNIDALRRTVNMFEMLSAEIKAKGLELIENHPKIRDCPLCGAQYESGQLASRIKSHQLDSVSSQELQSFSKLSIEKKAELIEAEQMLSNLKQVRQASSMFLDDTVLNKLPIVKIVMKVMEELDRIGKVIMEIRELENIRENFKIRGLTEEYLTGVCDWFQKQYGIRPFELSSKEVFMKLKADRVKRRTGLDNEINNARTKINDIVSRKNEVIAQYFSRVFTKEGDLEDLHRRMNNLNDVKKQLQFVIDNINFPDHEIFLNLINRLKEAKFVCETYISIVSAQKANQAIVEKNEKRIKEANIGIAKIKPKKDRADKALEVINKILGAHDKDNYLLEVLSAQKEELLAIFKMIHAPREFKDIKIAKNKISLMRESGKGCIVKQISAGQRSALALSLFLTMNRKLKNGPPYLIFDDPVAYVDDLNILSFLDYLREVALYGNRQVFFATANQKIATIFRKKFEFLGQDSFKVYVLTR